ncbi:urea transporter [Pseudomonas sp. JS3066]|uniref:urea transporter n=1 Tax=unclassified Pseudomonas TaxID=196821 RepID=UPI000EAA08AB|nr:MULTISPECIES: urea transporter [unclassified Pseudomonas]AYF87553.1 urea transporter [Pseudomonas sp. DY-1]MDH4651510.1 urea transporter [Pseudomonas sp. BN606]MRK19221.1 urea transporter [Pseudomonas sp. JG-B]WVK94937.1 urea transporter [Pseudomonas sp. JS3066]
MYRLPLRPEVRSWASAQLNGFSQIFLQRHPGCGALILLAIAVGAPNLLGGALLGGAASWLTAVRRRYAPDDIEAGLYGYNGVLLGLLLSARFEPSLYLALLILCASGLSSLLLNALLKAVRQHNWLPAYTAPFVGLGWILLALGGPLELTPTTTAGTTLHSGWIDTPMAIIRGIGQVIFLDQPTAGALVLGALFLAGWRVGLWALLGSSTALVLALLQGMPMQAVLVGLFSLNGALIALALGKDLRRPWCALAGILLGIALQPGFAALGLPAMTAPFILACWLVLVAKRMMGLAQPAPSRTL